MKPLAVDARRHFVDTVGSTKTARGACLILREHGVEGIIVKSDHLV
jgi:hypothetical protein